MLKRELVSANMVKITAFFGFLELLLGVLFYMVTGGTAVTALIPAIFGLLMLVTSLIGKRDHLRKHAMHCAAMLGLLGILGSIKSVGKIGALIAGTAERPAAITEQLIFLVLSATFLFLCVRSFIEARKARVAQT